MIKGLLLLSDLNPQHQEQHRILFQNSLGIVEKVSTAAPTTSTLPVGYCQLANISGTRRLYFNIGGAIYFVNLTAA